MAFSALESVTGHVPTWYERGFNLKPKLCPKQTLKPNIKHEAIGCDTFSHAKRNKPSLHSTSPNLIYFQVPKPEALEAHQLSKCPPGWAVAYSFLCDSVLYAKDGLNQLSMG